MDLFILISALASQAADEPPIVIDEPAITLIAARTPVPAPDAAASLTLFDQAALDDLALSALPDLLRLAPGVAVATTGPRGTQAQVRIRGAEANHSLIFIDGIRFNDPAAGNEARFELLTADSLSRLEVVRGPQSALWGSEALGGVIAAATPSPLTNAGGEAMAEYGSLGSARLSGRYAGRFGEVGVMASAGWLGSDGVDSFGANGERDGFDNVAASLKIEGRPSNALSLGFVGHWIEGTSQYDGFDSLTFLRADTLDETGNRIAAVRGWASASWSGWQVSADASYLDSANRNRLAGAPLNSTFGDRLTLSAQMARSLEGHRLIAAAEYQTEGFRARDTSFFGATDQDRHRSGTAFVGEWRAEWSPAVATDVALRHDRFSAFRDATTFRASLLVRPIYRVTVHAAYGSGVAQPTFYDLYGFFPGSFAGNPALAPEHSRGWEAGIAWRNARFSLAATWFSARLRHEIVDVFDPQTFLSSTANASGASRRRGLELSFGYSAGDGLSLTANYTFLDAGEQRVAGAALIREVRRARHSANLVAHGEAGRLRWGASLSYVGARRDLDFDQFPAAAVRLGAYVLGSANFAFRLRERLELYARAENAFDADYQDVVGYNTPGRTVHAGVRLAFGG